MRFFYRKNFSIVKKINFNFLVYTDIYEGILFRKKHIKYVLFSQKYTIHTIYENLYLYKLSTI